jgi:hypothetical protein
MGSDHGAIDVMQVPVQLASGIGLRLHRRQELALDARPLPAIEAAGHGTPRTIALGEIAPGSAGAEHPQDAIDDRAMVLGFWGGSRGWSLSHWMVVNSPRFMSPHLRSNWRV